MGLVDETASFFDGLEFLNDSTQLAIIISLSIFSAILMVWLEGPSRNEQDQKDKPNPMQGNGFMKGYSKPDIPPKSLEELLALETRDESKPMITL